MARRCQATNFCLIQCWLRSTTTCGVTRLQLIINSSWTFIYVMNFLVCACCQFSGFFSCDQAALWMVFSVPPSVCLSVCLSVCPSVRLSVCLSVCRSVCLSVTPFSLCFHHRIMKFSGVITSDKSDVRVKGQGRRSKVKVTEVTTQLNRFWTVTPV